MTDNPLTDTARLKRRNAGALPKGEPKIKEATMKKRFLALLLAVCIGVSVLVLPASAAGSNTAVQTAVMSAPVSIWRRSTSSRGALMTVSLSDSTT